MRRDGWIACCQSLAARYRCPLGASSSRSWSRRSGSWVSGKRSLGVRSAFVAVSTVSPDGQEAIASEVAFCPCSHVSADENGGRTHWCSVQLQDGVLMNPSSPLARQLPHACYGLHVSPRLILRTLQESCCVLTNRLFCIPSLLLDSNPKTAPQLRGYCLVRWCDASDCAARADVTLLELDELADGDISDGVVG